jgi:putative lipoprotein (rSAM/lipoprotein system)
MKAKALTLYSKILAFFLTLLGFQSCDKDSPVEYGSPFARFKVNGTVVSEDNGEPVKDIRAVLVPVYPTESGNQEYYYGDTLRTDEQGKFAFESEVYSIYYNLKLEDVDGEENGSYEPKTVFVDFTGAEYTGGDNRWYVGEATKDLGEVVIKPTRNKEE